MPKTQGLPDLVSCKANATCGVSELETTGCFTASMTDNGLLILLESVIGERPIAKLKSNHTMHRAAFETCLCTVLDHGDIRLLGAAAERGR